MAGYSSAEDLQRILGAPVTITSGDRSPQRNRLVGGVSNSAHLQPGMAVDFVPQGISTKDAAAKLAKAGLPFDQIIDENDHVHVSQDPRNRQQVLGPKVANVSDADLLNMMGGAPKEAATAKAVNVTDDQLLSAMGGGSGAPAGPGSPRQAPAGAAPGGKPSYMGKEFGFGEEMAAHMPFGKDVAAGVPALLDTITGKGSLGANYRQNLADYNAAQQGYEAENPGYSLGAQGLGIMASGSPLKSVGPIAQQTLGQLMKAGAKGGATLGALFGAGDAAPTFNERAGNAATGALFGAGAGVGLPVLGAGAGAAGQQIGKAASRMFPDAGTIASKRAKAIIEKFAGGALSPDARELVPGSLPTMPEATGNAGAAGLYRALRDLNPNSPLVQRETENAAARGEYAEKIIGSHADIEAAQEARDLVTDKMRDAAFENANATDVKSVRSSINKILSSPAGQRDVVASSLAGIRDKLELDYPLSERVGDAISPLKDAISSGKLGEDKLADFVEARRLLNSANRGHTSEEDLIKGLTALAKNQKIVGPIDNALRVIKSGGIKLQNDPAQLYGIRQALTDKLSPLAQGTGSDARLAASELIEIKKSLDNAIERGASGYKDYLKTFSGMSEPINAMEFLQKNKITDNNGKVTLGKVQSVLDRLEKEKNKGGIQNAKHVSDEQIKALTALRDDLRRAGRTSHGKAIGSNTIQNDLAQKRLGLSRFIPEGLGATLGGVAGSHFGGGIGMDIGAMIGGRIGNIVGAGRRAKQLEAQNLLQSTLEDMMLNPSKYQNPHQGVPSQIRSLNDLLSSTKFNTAVTGGNRLAIEARPKEKRR